MTNEEKIQKILENADNCNYRIEQVIAIISNPNSPLSGGMAEWLRKIGVEDKRIETTLDETLSNEARIAILKKLMGKYDLNNKAVAKMLKCSVSLIANYRAGILPIQMNKLIELQKIINAISEVK